MAGEPAVGQAVLERAERLPVRGALLPPGIVAAPLAHRAALAGDDLGRAEVIAVQPDGLGGAGAGRDANRHRLRASLDVVPMRDQAPFGLALVDPADHQRDRGASGIRLTLAEYAVV